MNPNPIQNLLLALALVSLAACSSGRVGDPPLAAAQTVTALQPAGRPAPAFSLPAPSALLAIPAREASTVNTALVKSGDAYDSALPSNLVSSPVANSATFDSQFSAGQSLDKLAYAIYRFDLSAYSGPLDFYHGWGKAPKAGCSAWLGVSNFATDRWDWIRLQTGELAPVTDAADHHATDGTLLAAVVIVGIDQPRLDLLMLGNEPPVASVISVDTLSGPPGLTVQFDGSGSSDPNDNIVRYDWDPEGDGTYLPHIGVGSPMFSRVYCNPGVYQTTLRVHDEQGAEDTASLSVTVSLGTRVDIEVDVLGNEEAGNLSLREVNGKAALAYITDTALYYSRATSASGQTWVSPLELTTACVNNGVDLCVVGGRPALAFQTDGYELACAWANDADGANWPAHVIAAENDGNNPGIYPCIEDGNGHPIIAAADASAFTSGDLWLYRATSSDLSSWAPPLKLSGTAPGVIGSLAWIDGVPSLVYSTAAGLAGYDRMRYVRANANWDVSWQPPLAPLASGEHATNNSSLGEVAQRPAIVFLDAQNGGLKYLHAVDSDGAEWNGIVDLPGAASVSELGYAFCVVNGIPCLAYAAKEGNLFAGVYLVLARDTLGSVWDDPIIIDQDAYSSWVSLAEINGRPAVAWVNADTKVIHYCGFKP